MYRLRLAWLKWGGIDSMSHGVFGIDQSMDLNR